MKSRVIILPDPYLLSLPFSARCLFTVLLGMVFFVSLTGPTLDQLHFIARLEVLLKLNTLLPLSVVCSSSIIIIIIIIIILFIFNVTQINISWVEIWRKWRPQFLIIVTKPISKQGVELFGVLKGWLQNVCNPSVRIF
jgi:hypothetical protein